MRKDKDREMQEAETRLKEILMRAVKDRLPDHAFSKGYQAGVADTLDFIGLLVLMAVTGEWPLH